MISCEKKVCSRDVVTESGDEVSPGVATLPATWVFQKTSGDGKKKSPETTQTDKGDANDTREDEYEELTGLSPIIMERRVNSCCVWRLRVSQDHAFSLRRNTDHTSSFCGDWWPFFALPVLVCAPPGPVLSPCPFGLPLRLLPVVATPTSSSSCLPWHIWRDSL